jgi:hypothetical protein
VSYRWAYLRWGGTVAVGAAVVVVSVLAAVAALAVSGGGLGNNGGRPARPAAISSPTRSAPTTPAPYRPPRITPARTAQQSQVDAELAQAEQPVVLPPGGVSVLPAGGDSTGYPAVPVPDLNDPAAYATAFVTELVDRDYARQYRRDLLAWAQAESAPNSLPGVAPGLAGYSLVLSLINPVPPPGPVPSVAGWAQAARSGRAQSVTNLETVVNPQWLALTATGWQPDDPAMTVLTVTGDLISRGAGRSESGSFSLELTLGSNGSRPGYGAVAVDDWTVL